MTVPLLSPPAQFGQPGFKDDKGYVTLPRRLPSTSTTTSNTSPTHRGMMDWSLMTDRGPVYDGVGPRTSATGASATMNRKSSEGNNNAAKMMSIPEMDEHQMHLQQQQHQQQQHQQQQQQQHQYFFNNARLRTSSLKRFPMGNSHLHQPCLIMSSSSG